MVENTVAEYSCRVNLMSVGDSRMVRLPDCQSVGWEVNRRTVGKWVGQKVGRRVVGCWWTARQSVGQSNCQSVGRSVSLVGRPQEDIAKMIDSFEWVE